MYGKVRSAPGTEPFYLIETDNGILLKLASSRVERVREKTPAQIEYETLAAAMADTVEQHLTMADWCRDNRLTKERNFHLFAVLRLDPNHKETRSKLDYTQRADGRWMRIDQLRIEQGLVREGSKWYPKEWMEIEEAKTQQRIAVGKWNGEISRLRKLYDKPDRRGEAIAALQAIQDPIAGIALSEAFEKEKSVDVRMLYVEILGKLDSGAARKTLVVAAMKEDDDRVREECLRILKQKNSPVIAADFIRGLDPNLNTENRFLNRPAIALGWLDAREAVRPLIDSLVTEHRAPNLAAGGGNINVGGNGAFAVGGKQPAVILQNLRNPGVLQTLKAITGEDFQYDTEAWIRWYAMSQTPAGIDLRRNR